MVKRPASLQGRLLVLVLTISLVVWLAAAALAWRDASHELDELLDGHLAQAAALLVAQQAHEQDGDDEVDAPDLHRYAPRVAFQVFHEGRLTLRSANAPTTPMVQGARDGFQWVAMQGKRWRVFSTAGGARDVQVLVGEQEGSRRSILGAVLRSMLWPVAIALPLLALGLWWAVRQGTRPLRTLGGALARRRADDLQPVAVPDAPAEMQPLLAALNTLFGRIQALLEGERRFTGDAAHELRTPIAAIRAQAQVALAAGDEPLRRHALEATLAGCDRATRLVEQLLTLSRLEAAGTAPQGRVDLAQVLARVLAELAPASLRKHQALDFEGPPNAWVTGDETLLAVLARNLVDNAVRYSPRRARIEVRVEREGERIQLQVADSGPGLAPEDLGRLGQRFFRVTGAEAPGSGLGWSIVQRIAAAHGASLHARASPRLRGLQVTASFPGAPDAAMRK